MRRVLSDRNVRNGGVLETGNSRRNGKSLGIGRACWRLGGQEQPVGREAI